MLQSLRNYMSADERAKRQRKATSKALKTERRGIVAMRVAGMAREFEIDRLEAELKRADEPKPAVERRATLRVVMVEDDACLPEGWFPADIDIPCELAGVAR